MRGSHSIIATFPLANTPRATARRLFVKLALVGARLPGAWYIHLATPQSQRSRTEYGIV